MADTYPDEVWPSDASIEVLDGTTDASTGLPYIAKGVSPASTPSYEVQYNRRLARQNAALSLSNQGRVVDEGGLSIGAYPLDAMIGGAAVRFEGATGQACADDDVNHVYVDSAGALQVVTDATGWPSAAGTYMPLAEVTCASGDITSIEDVRGRGVHMIDYVDAAGLAGDGLEDDGSGNLRVKLDGATVARSASGVAVADGSLDGQQMANVGTDGGVMLILSATLAGGNTVTIHNADAPFKYRIVDAWSVATSADGGSWYLDDGATARTDTVTVTSTDKAIDRIGQLDDGYQDVAASGTLRVVGDGANADADVYVMVMRVS